mgnify:CR=1 FL=1
MRFEVFRTQHIGFCFGVNRAVSALYEELNHPSGKRVVTFGPIIHNDEINRDLKTRGVVVTEDLSEIRQGDLVFVRTHGVGNAVLSRLRNCGAEVHDMTCPRVKHIHEIVRAAEHPVVVGDCRHPEVRGILGNIPGESRQISGTEDLEDFLQSMNPAWTYTVVFQTTYSVQEFEKIKARLSAFSNIVVLDTICRSTFDRQHEVDALARRVDAMLIVGSKQSSNTRKLYETAKQHCDAYLIGNANEIPRQIYQYKKIGLSAGASTPGEAVEEVINNMENENKEIFTDEDIDFAAAVDASMKIIRNGQRVSGIITEINGNEIQVDLGTKHSGVIPAEEFSEDEQPHVGDPIEAVVIKVKDSEGIVELSKKKIDLEKGFEKIVELQQSGEICTGKVQQVVKGGLVVSYNKVRVFIPASHVELRKNVNLDEYAGKDVRFKIIEVENKGRSSRVIGSIRTVLKEEKDQKASELWANIEVGKKYTGVVKSLTDFGVFVDIGGGDGLVHITDLAWGRVKHPSDIVKVGDVVEVEVKSFDPETKKISLLYKKEEDNPWTIFMAKFEVGDVVPVKVQKLMTYGAFVSIIPGVDGLVHISQLANHRVEKVSDVLKVGQELDAKIVAIDEEKKKVSLSIKALEDDSDAQDAEASDAE